MSRCTRLASKRTGCRGGVVDGGGVGVGVDRGEGAADAVATVVGAVAALGTGVGPGPGDSAGPEHPASEATSAATRTGALLIW